MSLQLTPEQAAAMHEHLRRAYPEEGCGVLLGRDTGGDRGVGRVMGFDKERADSRHNRYVISPEQFLAADTSVARELESGVVVAILPDGADRYLGDPLWENAR